MEVNLATKAFKKRNHVLTPVHWTAISVTGLHGRTVARLVVAITIQFVPLNMVLCMVVSSVKASCTERIPATVRHVSSQFRATSPTGKTGRGAVLMITTRSTANVKSKMQQLGMGSGATIRFMRLFLATSMRIFVTA